VRVTLKKHQLHLLACSPVDNLSMHPFKGHLSREKAISLTRKCNFLVDVFSKLRTSLPLPEFHPVLMSVFTAPCTHQD